VVISRAHGSTRYPGPHPARTGRQSVSVRPGDLRPNHAGVHLIGIERLGTRLSTYQPWHRLLDWSDDLAGLSELHQYDGVLNYQTPKFRLVNHLFPCSATPAGDTPAQAALLPNRRR
jgi:hypothetical protein